MTIMDTLLAAALELSPDERIELSERLLESIPAEAVQLHPGWAEEFRRRVAEYDAGLVQSVPWSEVQDAINRSIAEQAATRRG